MKCPIDETELQMAERQGAGIDYHSKCRGIRLERGDLDKIIERAAGDATPSAPQDYRAGHGGRHGNHGLGYHGKGKRRGFAGELSDF